mmetsp:Transcript_19596/g.42823  ORF Transcript_19596/g.42823 Transcript_19596/m.42823 type:complete len:310 (-) Transcript_19596:93-1022(-)
MRSWEDILRSMGSAGAATIVVRTAEAPLERIKILLQNQNMALPGHVRYSGVTDAALRVAREQGFLAFWRGNLTNCARVVPSSALRFTFMDLFQVKLVRATGGGDGGGTQVLSLKLQMLSAGLSGGITALALYPLDLVRTKLAADVGAKRQYSGVVCCLRQTFTQHGLRGLYRGVLVSVAEISPYTALSMGGYEYFKRTLPTSEASQSALWWQQMQKVGVGWLVGLVASLTCYPLDTVKRQLMLDGSLGFQSKYDGSVLKCVGVMYKEGGMHSFYRGCLFNALKSAPAAGLTFVVNDAFRAVAGFRAVGS